MKIQTQNAFLALGDPWEMGNIGKLAQEASWYLAVMGAPIPIAIGDGLSVDGFVIWWRFKIEQNPEAELNQGKEL
jgi:hypothetical protein